MKAEYVSTLADEPTVVSAVYTADDVVRLVDTVRLESDQSAVSSEGQVPLIALFGI